MCVCGCLFVPLLGDEITGSVCNVTDETRSRLVGGGVQVSENQGRRFHACRLTLIFFAVTRDNSVFLVLVCDFDCALYFMGHMNTDWS